MLRDSIVAFVAHSGARHVAHYAVDPRAAPSLMTLFEKNPIDDETTDAYNDDAFGLVFLSGSVIGHDVMFSTTFLLLSALAAISIKQRIITAEEWVPGAVAASAFLITNIAMAVLDPSLAILSKDGNAMIIETAVCGISVLYSLFRSSQAARKP